MQSRAYSAIAVGYQNECDSLRSSLSNVYRKYGIIGLWRGKCLFETNSSFMAKVMVDINGGKTNFLNTSLHYHGLSTIYYIQKEESWPYG